ncbi:hypothetical protein SAMN02745157_3482 [Kaistia soli DSM 19436]|uniref:Uncharacterized protein n=1 Tax=Kaistia soli DSM 19436 TaxID=1122133 RepID=A0A1M5GQ24_9HYPH|nr:hypothetical protein SAMN02745157_3482 [Kaistia soli DSM 19436]
MTSVSPVDPAVSIYPLPMSARRARFEARNARRHRLKLPKGHPYRSLPIWIPYKLAIIISRSQYQPS